jgi:ATP-dependent DNA helicase RecG
MAFPLRYNKKIDCVVIEEHCNGNDVYLEGLIIQSSPYPPKNTKIFKALMHDKNRTALEIIFFQHHQWIANQLQAGKRVRVFGKIVHTAYGWQMSHPEIESIIRDQPIHPVIEPVYSQHQGISKKTFSHVVRFFIEEYNKHNVDQSCVFFSNFKILHAFDLSVEQMKTFDDLYHRALREMAYWEGVSYFRQHASRTDYQRTLSALCLEDGGYVPILLKRFQHDLTQGQEDAWNVLREDLKKTQPLNRLIQGDVGSGKTILGFLSLMMSANCETQSVFMAPTELLAAQHYHRLQTLIGDMLPCLLLTGSLTAAQKKLAYEKIESGEALVIIGTQAVFQDRVIFHKLSLVVVDEQQRFGVAQRTKLLQKSQYAAHYLTLTATPIPRTLSLAMFGHMDRCILKDKPHGRLPVKTYTIPSSKRHLLIKSMQNCLAKKHSIYWVCPFIEESATLEVKAAQRTYEVLCQEPGLKDVVIGLLHGKMSSSERHHVLNAFYEQKIHILVSTLVIEVGIDDPKATLMIIESPERLGLAQLHQLRGRVGRGVHQSYCLLVYDDGLKESGIERLQALCEHDDGLALAEIDLKMRGPGEFLGSQQSGFQALKFFSFDKHQDLLEKISDKIKILTDSEHQLLDTIFDLKIQKDHWEC